MSPAIKTLYLLPHAHTDIGYSHDPLVALELHDRFLDRAIGLCEQTRDYPDGARFRWTVEVFAMVLHWWEHRPTAAHERLRECLRRGEIDIGARYLNGTELYAPEDIAWEMREFERLAGLTGCRPAAAIQNDVNGFPLAFATPLAAAGVKTVVMGLNTTMGHSPFPRCHAFRWQTGEGRELLVWNGWIYNRIKTFCHLDRLAEDLPARLAAFFGSLPAGYPHDFAMTSATMGDNIGPFPLLPEQVRRFNENHTGCRLRLATFAEFAQVLSACRGQLAVHAGHWPDFWTFGAGAMPQMVASLRRAQRRLRLVEQFRGLGWANETGGSLTLDRARRAVAFACEHTYDSHTSSGLQCGSSDALRQKAQLQVEAATAESAAMVLLRDHLAAMAAKLPPGPVRVLAANPHPWPLEIDYLSEEKGLRCFAASRRPEHLYQFDREPTFEALAAAGTFGALDVRIPPRESVSVPLNALPAPTGETLDSDSGAGLTLGQGDTCLSWDRERLGVTSWRIGGTEMLAGDAEFAAFAPVREIPLGSFQVSGAGMADMDPADCAWNPRLRLERSLLPGRVSAVKRLRSARQQTLSLEFATAPLTSLRLTLDVRQPQRLSVATDWRLDADPSVRADYLALPLDLPGNGDCEYWVDACGEWFRAERDQLPGTCNSFYQAHRGVAVSRGGHTLYLAVADTTLFQFGGFTFAQLPAVPLQRRQPFVALWIYNNYWGTNFPSYSPGLFQARFLLEYRPEPFHPDRATQLAAAFDADYLTHPVA